MTARLTDQLLQSYSSWAWLTDNSTKGRRYVATKMSGTACETTLLGDCSSRAYAREESAWPAREKRATTPGSPRFARFSRTTNSRSRQTRKFHHCSRRGFIVAICDRFVSIGIRWNEAMLARQTTPTDSRIRRGNMRRAYTRRLKIDIA